MIQGHCPKCDWQTSQPVLIGTTLFCEDCGSDFTAKEAEPAQQDIHINTDHVTAVMPVVVPLSSEQSVLSQSACPTPVAALARKTAELLRPGYKSTSGLPSFPLELSFTFNYVLLAGANSSCEYTLKNNAADTVSRIKLTIDCDALEGSRLEVEHSPLTTGEENSDPIQLKLNRDIHGHVLLRCTLEVGTPFGIRTAEGKLQGVVILPSTASAKEISLHVGDNFALGAEGGVSLNLGGQSTDHDLLQRCLKNVPALAVSLRERGSIFVEQLPHHYVNGQQMEFVRVTVGTQSVWFCHHQTTQLNWNQITGSLQEEQLKKRGSTHCGLDPRMPVYGINLTEAQEFCHQLNQLELDSGGLPPGYAYRLPTEAEWRAASGPASYTDRELQHHAWTMLAKVTGPQLVGCLRPNDFGLYDMRGNVFEWCEMESPSTEKVPVYGGSWYADPQGGDLEAARQGSRILCPPTTRSSRVGMRIVLAPRI